MKDESQRNSDWQVAARASTSRGCRAAAAARAARPRAHPRRGAAGRSRSPRRRWCSARAHTRPPSSLRPRRAALRARAPSPHRMRRREADLDLTNRVQIRRLGGGAERVALVRVATLGEVPEQVGAHSHEEDGLSPPSALASSVSHICTASLHVSSSSSVTRSMYSRHCSARSVATMCAAEPERSRRPPRPPPSRRCPRRAATALGGR